MNQFTVLVIFSFLVISCDYTHLNERDFALNANNGSSCVEGSVETPSPVDYFTVRDQVFQQSCFNCHGNGNSSGGVSLSTYEQAFRLADRISSSVESGRMPLGGSLTQTQIDLVVDWVRLGALEGSPQNKKNCDPPAGDDNNKNDSDNNDPDNTDPIDSVDPQSPHAPLDEVPNDSEITFSLVRDKIFQNRCFACHSDVGGNVDGLNLETYFGTLEEIEDVEERVLKNEMPPGQPINLIEKETLLRWINLGAPEQ